jgi:hypothetical protein
MPCDRYSEAKIRYVSGELPAPPPDLAEHLGVCSDCRKEVEEMREVRDIYRSQPEPRPLPYHPPTRTRLTVFVTAAAALLIAVTGWFITQIPSAPKPPPAETSQAIVPTGSFGGMEIDEQIEEVRMRLAAIKIDNDGF